MVKQGVRPPSSANDNNANNTDENNEAIDFLEDQPSEMTYGRRIALWLMQYKWYNPQLKLQQPKKDDDNSDTGKENEQDKEEEVDELIQPLLEQHTTNQTQQLPSIEKAWAFFEHVTLPRYIYKPEDGEYPEKMDRAQPGESMLKTKLYSPISTPIQQMGDFGIGIGLYFSALKSAVILMFIAGICSIPNIVYYASKEYSDNQQEGVEGYLIGTAICTDTTWVQCPTCDEGDFKVAEYRLKTEDGIQYALKNNCKSPPIAIGLTSWFTLIVIGLGFIIIKICQDRIRVEMDEDEQTATDYSITVSNAPGDAQDPKEWKDFFETQCEFGKVATITICLNNDELVRSLVKRRECVLSISRLIRRRNVSDEELQGLADEQRFKNSQRWCINRMFQKCILYPIGIYDIAKLQEKYEKFSIKIKELVKATEESPYPVSNIFVTFNTEEAQRKCLDALSCGKIHAALNNTYAFDGTKHLFRETQVLLVDEAEEPTTIRWQHLNMTFFGRMKIITFTLFVTLCAIITLAFIVKLVHDGSSARSAYVVAAFNQLFPQFCMAITRMEPHSNASDKQTSLFIKIALFRWVNTVIIIDLVTPFVNSLSDSSINGDHAALIPSIFAIFKADLIVMILLQLLDPIGNFMRHFKGPRGYDQDAMNRNFKGANWRLAERYTNMSKVLFLSFFYATIFPSALFLCSGSLLIAYYIDRYSIMRTWKRNPQIGPAIAFFNDRFIVPFYLLALSIFSSYSWASFPYDNLCSVDSFESNYPTKSPSILNYDDNLFNDDNTVRNSIFTGGYSETEMVYEYCDQNLLFKEFPVLEHKSWMTEDQRKMTKLFGFTSIAVVLLMIIFFGFMALRKILNFFRSDYSPDGRDMNIPFSELEDRCGYVPQVETKQSPYPLIAGDVSNMDDELYDWVSDEHPYDYYNVTLDLKDILSATELEEASTKTLFSFVKDFLLDDDNAAADSATNAAAVVTSTQ